MSDELFDLYNACNGALYNGVLDTRKLNELSEQEIELLDLPRLKELGNHVTSGCAECRAVIDTLNFARSMLGENAEQHHSTQTQAVEAD